VFDEHRRAIAKLHKLVFLGVEDLLFRLLADLSRNHLCDRKKREGKDQRGSNGDCRSRFPIQAPSRCHCRPAFVSGLISVLTPLFCPPGGKDIRRSTDAST
jgi:hypothetical protein